MPVRNPISKNQEDGSLGMASKVDLSLPQSVCTWAHMRVWGRGKGRKIRREREIENLAKNFFAE